MIKFLHAADFHLDAAFSSLSPEQGRERRREQREALKELAAASADCDFVLLAGDLFDSNKVYLDTVEALKECFASMEIPVYIAPGNHDPMREDCPYSREDWGENVHIFTKQEIERLELPGCDLYGAGYTEGNWEPLKDFRVEEEERLNLMLLHSGAEYNPVTVEQILASGLDYLALGHVHDLRICREDYTTYAYPGCLMGRGFDECGKKGFLKVRLSKVACDTEFIPLNSRRYEILEVELEDQADPLEQILEALPTDSSEHIFRIVLQGHCPKPDTELLGKALSEHCYAVELLDKTEGSGDLWEGITEDTLRGEVLKELKSRLDAAGEEEQEQILRAAKLIRDLMDGREISV